ncbi:MAG TPA: hypothetical protein VGM90_24125 [Kofleriaceae bacterium]|jgi:hypothetical protein
MRAKFFVVVAALGGVVLANPAPRRVVVTDPDPELLQAIKVSLRPWRIEVVTTPDDSAEFVVSREGDELVVMDRQHATTERRPARSGVLDPVSAAESALTVKTMMRLPPPETVETEVPTIPVEPEQSGVAVRVQLGAGVNAALGGDDGTVANGQLGVFVRPGSTNWRFGMRGELATSTSVDVGGFKGTWNELAVLGIASWSHSLGASLEIEPWLGAGVARGVLDGTETMMIVRHETSVGARLAGGGIVRWVHGAFSVGAGLELDGSPGRSTYTKTTQGMGNPAIFNASSVALAAGVLAAIELGR